MDSTTERLKVHLGKLSAGPERTCIPAEKLKRLLRQLDQSSTCLSEEGLDTFMAMTHKETNGLINVSTFVDWVFTNDDEEGGMPGMSPQESQPSIVVFWSNHQTPGSRDERLAWMARVLAKDVGAVDEEKMSIKASLPPFNISKDVEMPSSVSSINVPVYGPNIPNSVIRLFETSEMRDLAKSVSCRIPSYTLNKIVQGKMEKVLDLVNVARSLEDIAQRNGAAIDKLESFAKDLQDLKPSDITDVSAWSTFVNKYASNGWAQKLHFDHLLDNFGFDKLASDVLRQSKYTYPDGEQMTFENHAFRWLSKALAAYGVEGCLTDVVNLVFAMMGIETKETDEGKVAAHLDHFRDNVLAKKDFSKLWVPSYFVMDAEVDDSLAWVILKYVHGARGTTLQTFVQLPIEEEIDQIAATLKKMDHVYVFRDPEAKNQKAVMQNFGLHNH